MEKPTTIADLIQQARDAADQLSVTSEQIRRDMLEIYHMLGLRAPDSLRKPERNTEPSR